MYTFDSRVRYSETDETGCLKLRSIIDYMQDCSTFQSEDAGVGVKYLTKEHKAWLLSSWHIKVLRCPALGERIAISTWPTSVKGIYGYRNFQLKDEAGNYLVKAASLWFLYDTEKNVPIRVLPEDIAPYGPYEPELELPPAPRKIAIPQEYEEKEAILVGRHHIDTNHHVNNAVYVDFAREVIPSGIRIQEIRADYKKAALLGDVVVPGVLQGEDGAWTVVLKSPVGEVYAAVWLKGERND